MTISLIVINQYQCLNFVIAIFIIFAIIILINSNIIYD